MPLPVAAIAYGMIAGGGLAGCAAAVQRLYDYFSSSTEQQDAEDEKMMPVLKSAGMVLAPFRFDRTIEAIPQKDRELLQSEARTLTPLARKQVNEVAKAKYGKTFSRLSKAQQLSIFEELAMEYQNTH